MSKNDVSYVILSLKYVFYVFMSKNDVSYIILSLQYVFMSYATNTKENDTFDKTTLRQNE